MNMVHVLPLCDAVPVHESSHSERTMSVSKTGTPVREHRTQIARRIVGWLRQSYPAKTAEHVAADLKVTPEAVQKWQSRESAPSIETFAAMGEKYGPEFVLSAFPSWTWLEPLARAELTRRLENEIAERRRRIAELAGQ